jgi:ribonuclease VapC
VSRAGGPAAVLDASAVLALFRKEDGAPRVREIVEGGALISAVNWAEVLSRLTDLGGDPTEVAATALPSGPAGHVQLVPFDDEQSRETARLRPRTRALGLSLCDRAALALARLRGLRVVTTDRAWRSLRLAIRIEVVR